MAAAGGLARLAAMIVAGVAAAAAHEAQAQPAGALSPAAICVSATTRLKLTDAELDTAARAAEAVLARRGADGQRGDVALSALSVPAQEGDPAKASSIAAYCAAAGESVRLAKSGSQLQAQSYLITAVAAAEQARDARVAALAAYRLGLATVGGPTPVESSRGAAGPAGPAVAAGGGPAATGPCGVLARPTLLLRPGAEIVETALVCAGQRARAAGDAEIAGLSSLRLARTRLAAGAVDAARREAFAGLADAGRVADPGLRVELLGRLVETAIAAGGASDARVGRAVADLRAAAAGGAAGEAYADALAGRMALARDDRAEAQALLRQAVYRESQRLQPLRQADWLLWLAEAEPERRAAHVTAAYRALEAVRPLLPLVDPITEEPTFALRMQPVFQQAVEVQLAPPTGAGEDRSIALAQEIVEAYRQAEVQSALGADCVPPREAVRPRELRAGEILLYPILLGDRIELIFAEGGAGGAEYHRLPPNRTADRATVAALVARMVASTSGEGDDRWREPARELYRLLIAPIEDRLTAEGSLVIIPDGPLRALPFAALADGQGRFLITRTRISVAPALTYSQPGADRSDRALAVVAASLQKDVDLPAGFFDRLEGTADEAKIAVTVGGAGSRGSRLIADFHKADLQAALSAGRVDVLHVATHASFNGRSDRSFIVANDEAIPMSDLRGLITANRARGDELDLLVLSACETAVGDDQASMGLAGAAVQAGARSAIASLWQVNDLGTAELMKAFYANYRAGQGKAEALRTAQLKLIAEGGAFAHPGIWGAFTLLGGWR